MNVYKISDISAMVKPIAEKYNINKIFLFGSYARGDANEESDIDLLVDYTKLNGLFALGGLFEDFRELFNKPVDIISERALQKCKNDEIDFCFFDNVMKDRVLIYER